MKYLTLIAPVVLASGLVSAQSNSTFCDGKPVGLYCDPNNESRKIECPNGEITTCPKAPGEICQERGKLKQNGFRGGIARCVPKLDPEAVKEFCSSRQTGTYCWPGPDSEGFVGNIKVQCPSGLVYKCRPSFDPNLICRQRNERYAVCVDQQRGTTACPVLTLTRNERYAVCVDQQRGTTACPVLTLTVTETVELTQTITECVTTPSPKPHTSFPPIIVQPGTVVEAGTEVFVTSTTQVDVERSTSTWATTSTWAVTSTPEPVVVTSHLTPVTIGF
ncbi:hypothetical protein MP638_003560 [Amoeboaphelidium occidentale]|nr:hypothetical protein MP638_003560 [Amoeboaphelidium occidentale]